MSVDGRKARPYYTLVTTQVGRLDLHLSIRRPSAALVPKVGFPLFEHRRLVLFWAACFQNMLETDTRQTLCSCVAADTQNFQTLPSLLPPKWENYIMHCGRNHHFSAGYSRVILLWATPSALLLLFPHPDCFRLQAVCKGARCDFAFTGCCFSETANEALQRQGQTLPLEYIQLNNQRLNHPSNPIPAER